MKYKLTLISSEGRAYFLRLPYTNEGKLAMSDRDWISLFNLAPGSRIIG